MKISKLFIILFTLFFTHQASALRCNSKVVTTGDSLYKFHRLCGEPSFVERRIVYRTKSVTSGYSEDWAYHTHDERIDTRNSNYRNKQRFHSSNHQRTVDYVETEIKHEQEEEIQIEEWTYDFGPHRLIQKIRFINGIAVKISPQGYGYSTK